MNYYFLAAFAGLIQGLTEFLPISSTGHLIIFQKIFNLPDNYFGLAFDASLHLGTLLAVLIFFFKDYLHALKSKRLLIALIVGTIPAVIAGLLFESYIDNQIRQLWIIGTALILFSFVMIYADKIGRNIKTIAKINTKDSLIIGLFQAIALIPGVSRSGSTISAGLFLNYTREDASRFAFLLSGPVIAGAGSKKFLEVLLSHGTQAGETQYFLVGMVSSAIFGYLTIKYFLKYIANHNLNVFIFYRIVLGLILISTIFWM
jgi:undecaprenyl-diphosphatase